LQTVNKITVLLIDGTYFALIWWKTKCYDFSETGNNVDEKWG